MRFTVGEVIRATVFLAGLLIIVEHAGGFSQVLKAGAGGYATVFQSISGHGAGGAAGYRSVKDARVR
jgi:hypothetical protein